MFGNVTVELSADSEKVRPIVEFGGSEFPPEYTIAGKRVACANSTPSIVELFLRGDAPDSYVNAVVFNDDATGPRVLKAGTRISLTENGATVFNGGLIKRADLSRSVRVIAADDRAILRRLPVFGCVTYDTGGKQVIFNAARPLRYNPFGFGNCIEVEVGGTPWPVPFHTWEATADAKLDAAVYDPGGDAAPEITFWTPLRILRNLYYRVAVWGPENYEGLPTLPLTVAWEAESLNLSGEDLEKKAPDFVVPATGELPGRSIAGLLDKACALAGSIGWVLRYRDGDMSDIDFFARTREAVSSFGGDEANGLAIMVQTSGVPSDARIAFDWTAEDDWTDTVYRAYIAGKPLVVEALLKLGEEFDEEGGEEAGDNDTLEKAWTDEEWEAFRGIINGDPPKEPGEEEEEEEEEEEGIKYALVDGVEMNGEDGAVKVLANTPEAVSLARQKYPLVMRGFRIKPGDLLDEKLQGVDEAFKEFLVNNAMMPRPILEAQVQNTIDPKTQKVVSLRFPPRVLVSSSASSTDFHDVTANPGWYVTDDGIIRLDGLTDDIAAPADRLYDGELCEPDEVDLRKIRINAAIALDARAFAEHGLAVPEDQGATDPNQIADQVHESLMDRTAGPFIYDESEWGVEHQVQSEPTAAASIPGLNDKEQDSPAGQAAQDAANEPPLTRIYRDETAEIESACARALKANQKPKRSAAYRLIGIRSDAQVGAWVSKVSFVPGGFPRLVGAPIERVEVEYVDKQSTAVHLEGY